jgi:hypothetical protein
MEFGMRVLIGALAPACLFATMVAANADTIVYDTTDVISYHGNSPTNYFSGNNRGDVIGSGFDTKSVSISESGNSITITFHTQFDGDDLTAHYADLFMTPNNADGSPSSWGFGVSLGFQQPYGGEAAGLYALSSAADYMTSQEIWSPKTQYTYGGRYVAPGEITKNLIPTRITGGLFESDWTVAVNKTTVGGEYPYELSITLTAANSSAFSLLDGTNLDVLWGTGDCGNDTIFAQYTRPVKTPEPGSIALLAGGLLVLRRRRK